MRISLVTETYFPQVNGVSRALDNLARYMQRCGDQMQLLVPRYEEPIPADGMEVETFRGTRLPFYREIIVPFPAPGRVGRCLRTFRPDVVHIATEGLLGHTALRAVRRLRLPVVSSYHTNFSMYTQSYSMGGLAKLVWRYLRWFHNRTAMTFCPTPSIKEQLDERGFHHVRVWRRGVDCELFDPARRDDALRARYHITPDDTVLLNVGRLANEKNLPLLLDVFQALQTDRPVKLLLVGGGPVQERVEREGNPDVILAGYQRGEELARHYAAADLMVFPSLSETFGNVVLEAMASGLPVIGFDAPGPRDIIREGETGHIVTTIEADAFRTTIQTLLNTPERIRTMGRAARTYAESQTWDAICKVVRDGYRETVDASAP